MNALNNSLRPASCSLDTVTGGAIVDSQGREIPITEDMIQRACQELESCWHAAPAFAAMGGPGRAEQGGCQ